jgi:hypothetical protein
LIRARSTECAAMNIRHWSKDGKRLKNEGISSCRA